MYEPQFIDVNQLNLTEMSLQSSSNWNDKWLTGSI